MKCKIKVVDMNTMLDRVTQTTDKKGPAGAATVCMVAEATGLVSFYSTNLVAEVNDKVACVVDEPGMSLIDPDQLRAGLAHRDPEDVAEFTLVKSGKGKHEVTRLRVTVGKNYFHLGYNLAGTEEMAKRMRAIPFDGTAAYTISGKALDAFVRRALPCIPRKNEGANRWEMSGMRVIGTDAGYEAHATDGYICARIRVKGDKGPGTMDALMPQQGLPPLAKLIKGVELVEVIPGNTNANGHVVKLFFRMGPNTFFSTRVLEGQFPNIEGVLQAHAAEYWLTVNREDLKCALQRATAFDSLRQVSLEIRHDRMIIRATSQAKVADLREELPVESEDLPNDLVLTRTFHVDYLLNIASVSSQEVLKLGVSDYTQTVKAGKALIINDVDGDVETLYALMPAAEAKVASTAAAEKVAA